jgi:hypothetical protein
MRWYLSKARNFESHLILLVLLVVYVKSRDVSVWRGFRILWTKLPRTLMSADDPALYITQGYHE